MNAESYVTLFVAIFIVVTAIVIALMFYGVDSANKETEKKFEDLTVDEKVVLLADLVMNENKDD